MQAVLTYKAELPFKCDLAFFVRKQVWIAFIYLQLLYYFDIGNLTLIIQKIRGEFRAYLQFCRSFDTLNLSLSADL